MPERAADGGHFRASQADRERVIDVLKTAFVEERLTKEAFDLRVDRALASRTYAELAPVTGDLHVSPAAARPTAGPVSTPARTLAKAARRSGVCMLAAFAVVGVASLTPGENQMAIFLAFFSVVAAVIAALGLLGYGVIDAWREHRSRGQLPSRPGQNSKGLESGQPGRDGRDRGRSGAHRDQSLFERCRARTQRGTGPVLGAF
ncbi:MAG TPA: DUF1707 domain-containing protein [Streptosporangiaceae bacterium]|nr:DUF1707 domain-containing protein [Streptosporangiaceae bacterium]